MNIVDEVERRGIELAMQLVTRAAAPGSPVIDTHDAENGEHWQRSLGDYLVQLDATGKWCGIDVKTEQRYTGNLFVESWSNKSGYRSRDGWIFTLGADWLFMVYLDVRAVFIVNLPRLKNWCVIEAHMLDYPEKTVHRFTDGDQRNKTTGHPVPWAALVETVGFKCYQIQGGNWVKCVLPDTRQRQTA